MQIFELPFEIRTMIYSYVFAGLKLKFKCQLRTRQSRTQQCNRLPDIFPPLAISLSCRHLKNDILWKETMLETAEVVIASKSEAAFLKHCLPKSDANKILRIQFPSLGRITWNMNVKKLFPNLKVLRLFTARKCHVPHYGKTHFIENFKERQDGVQTETESPSTITAIQARQESMAGWTTLGLTSAQLIQLMNRFEYSEIFRDCFQYHYVQPCCEKALKAGVELIYESQIFFDTLNERACDINITSKDWKLRITNLGNTVEIPQDIDGLF